MDAKQFRSMDYYKRLRVSEQASVETIKEAYRERAREYHPDVSDNEDAQEIFRLVKEAKETLVDEQKRNHYDRVGHEAYLRQQEGPGSAYSVDETTTHSEADDTPSQKTTGQTRGTSFVHGLNDIEDRHEPAPAYPEAGKTTKMLAYGLSIVLPAGVVCLFPIVWFSLFGLSGPGGSAGLVIVYLLTVIVATLATIIAAESLLDTPRSIRSSA